MLFVFWLLGCRQTTVEYCVEKVRDGEIYDAYVVRKIDDQTVEEVPVESCSAWYDGDTGWASE